MRTFRGIGHVKKNQIPPDLGVKLQPFDIVAIILWLTLRLCIV